MLQPTAPVGLDNSFLLSLKRLFFRESKWNCFSNSPVVLLRLIVFIVLQMTALSCHKKEKSCKRANIYRRLMTARRQCCKAEHEICVRKLFKVCKNPKCLRRHNRKCINKRKRCNKGKVPLNKISCGLRRKNNPRKQTPRKIPVRQPPNKKSKFV